MTPHARTRRALLLGSALRAASAVDQRSAILSSAACAAEDGGSRQGLGGTRP